VRRLLFFTLIIGLALTACGRKQMPQLVTDTPPQIVELRHEIGERAIKLTMRITGGSYGIGYQIDRAEMDPYCKCPGFWQRYREEFPAEKNIGKELSVALSLGDGTVEYAFRVRAVDGLGQLGPWSKPIRARAGALE